MHPILRNIIALVSGVILGMIVNMSFIMIGPSIIPPPEGTDVTTMHGLKEAMLIMQPKHFIFPFLAHALGVLVGSFIAVNIAAKHNLLFAMTVGALFFFGGVMMVFDLPSPAWFNAVDLIGAYFPMAFLGYVLAGKKS